MDHSPVALAQVYEGWDGYNTSLVRAIAPRTPEELAFRAAPEIRPAGQIAAHIAMGRINWFSRMPAPMAAELACETEHLRGAPEWGDEAYQAIATDAGALVHWLERTWEMIRSTLQEWTVDDLARTYPHTYQGKTYAVSYQWTIWRILAHDIQHGGQLTVVLAQQGIVPDDLTALGGHFTEPPIAATG